MRYVEWIVLFVLSGLGIGLANLVGFQVGFMDSLPGILILLAISLAGVVVSKLIPLKLPIVAYVSILGLLAASPICPAREFVIEGRSRSEMEAEKRASWEEISIAEHVAMYEQQGNSRKDAMKLAARDRGVSKRDIYKALLDGEGSAE